MKKLLLILLPLMLLACSREVEETPLYHKYAERHNLAVAQVSGFQLCDTVKTDVVIIVADDSAAWQKLKEELDIRASEGITSWMGAIDEPTPTPRLARHGRPCRAHRGLLPRGGLGAVSSPAGLPTGQIKQLKIKEYETVNETHSPAGRRIHLCGLRTRE